MRAAVLVPWAIPTAVTAKLWQFMFAPDGIVNSLLGAQIAWTTDPFYARFAVIIADVWKTAPFMALLILAGLQMIPKDVYDAARVDGAGDAQQHRPGGRDHPPIMKSIANAFDSDPAKYAAA